MEAFIRLRAEQQRNSSRRWRRRRSRYEMLPQVSAAEEGGSTLQILIRDEDANANADEVDI